MEMDLILKYMVKLLIIPHFLTHFEKNKKFTYWAYWLLQTTLFQPFPINNLQIPNTQ